MKKSTKGAIAAAAAGVLLLGGAGSLAYWTDSGTVSGANIASGHLKLASANCDGGWKIDGGTAYVAQKLVPGDFLTQNCTYTIDAAGDHLTATLDATSAALTGDQALRDELNLTADFKVGTTAVTPGTPVAIVNGDTVTATLKVNWPYGVEDNDSNTSAGLAAALANMTVNIKQVHTP